MFKAPAAKHFVAVRAMKRKSGYILQGVKKQEEEKEEGEMSGKRIRVDEGLREDRDSANSPFQLPFDRMSMEN